MNSISELYLVKQEVGEAVTEKVNAMFPTWTTVLATILAVLVLMVLLTKLLYHPIKKNFEDRKKYIQANIDEADKKNLDASADREKANGELIAARNEAAEIIARAKLFAEKKRLEKLALAKKESNNYVKSVKAEMEQERENFRKEAKKEVVDIALAAASRIIEKEVDNDTNRKIIKNFLETEVN